MRSDGVERYVSKWRGHVCKSRQKRIKVIHKARRKITKILEKLDKKDRGPTINGIRLINTTVYYNPVDLKGD